MDDLSGKIGEIFSNPESLEKIRALVNMLGAGGSTGDNIQDNEPERPREKPRENQSNAGGMPSNIPFDANTLAKMQKAFSLMQRDDPRVDFLLALKPNLSEDRRKKVDDAIHLLRLINLIPLLQEGILQ